MNHVTMSVGLVQEVVRTVSSEHLVTILVVKDILAQTVRGSVHLTVNLTHVYTQTVHVPCVLQAGWDIIVLQYAMGLLEWIVTLHAMLTVSTRRVIDSKAVVCMAV